jgi:hypothetical protein
MTTTTTQPQRSPQPVDAAESVDSIVLLSLSALRARKRLSGAASLVAHVRTLVVPAGAQRSDGLPRGGSEEAPAPLRIEPVDETDSVYAQLLNWVDYWSETLHITPPVTATYAWSNGREIQGFRAGVSPEGAGGLVQILTVWLLAHQDAIERHSAAGDYFDDVAGFLWDLDKKFPRSSRGTRPVLPRPCPVCDGPGMGVEWQSEQLLDFTLVCAFCGFEGSTGALLHDRDVRRLMTDMRIEDAPEPTEWWTKKQAAQEMRITPQTLNRYIQNDGLSTQTADGAVYVNTDELRSLWREKRSRDKAVREGKG